MISDEDIRRVREATDLVALVSETVVLRQKGREYWGRCPFHDEKTPSFKVDPRSQLYHCFGCHAGGDAYGFVMRTQNMEFQDAVRYLADRANITLAETQGGFSQGKRARLLEIMQASAEFYAQHLLRSKERGAAAARSYLSGRNMGSELAKQWQLGYAPGNASLSEYLHKKGYTLEECLDANVVAKGQRGQSRDRFYERVMFPVADLHGRIIAFGGRRIDSGEPKYLNTSETPLFHKRESLYAIDRAKAKISETGTAIVVEGYTDTIAMHAAGFTNTVATLGTALTMQHLKLLNRFAKKVIYLFDGDEAGKRAATRAAELITRDITPEAGIFRISLNVAELPPGTDPAELLAQRGASALQESLDKAKPLISYALEQSLSGMELATPEGRTEALRRALTVLLPIRGSILADRYIADELALSVGEDYTKVQAMFNNMQAPRGAAADEEEKPASTPLEPLRETPGGGAAETSLQNELLLLYIEYPEVRELLSQAFNKISWSSTELAQLAQGLGASERQAPSDELYALALSLVPSYAPVLSAGLQRSFAGSARDYAQLLMHMLREKQLLNEIALARIAYARANTQAEGAAHFKVIAEKQSELAQIRERLSQIPKTLV